MWWCLFFFQEEDGIRDKLVTGVQTCALPIYPTPVKVFFTFPCGSRTIDAHKEDFDWGWVGGGGIEYMLGCHWTIRAEIGRASCRERVWISGVAVSLKKKKSTG